MGRYMMELVLYHVLKLWFAEVHSFHEVFWQARISVRSFWLVIDFDVLLDSDGNGNFGRLKYVFFDILMIIII